MRILTNAFGLSAALAVILTLAGCGKDSKHNTVKVEGVVTLDDKPVPNATVTFRPVKEGSGAPATATTDDQGRYSLITVGTGTREAGAVPGEYHVGVIKTKIDTDTSGDSSDPNYGKQKVAYGKKAEKGVTHAVPQKYNKPEESGIKVTVEGGKDNDIPIELKSK